MTAELREGETRITLRAMAFEALIGVLDHESVEVQPIEVDLDLVIAASGARPDTHNILDYRHAYELVATIISAGHIPYLEEAAERIAEKALSLPLVVGVGVAVRKMRVALPGPLAFAQVSVERRRE